MNNQLTFRTIATFVCLSNLTLSAFGQETPTENETHIYWQTDLELSAKDFQGTGDHNPNAKKYCAEYGICTSASVGVFGVLDIPKKKKMHGELLEKAYFAPAFEKANSYILHYDSMGIQEQKIVFDIYEISARFARKELKKLQDSISGYGIQTIMFKTIEMRALQMRDDLTLRFTKEVYIDHSEGSFDKWRIELDNLLEKTKEFATKTEDCYRFIKQKPLDDRYIKAKKNFGNMK